MKYLSDRGHDDFGFLPLTNVGCSKSTQLNA